MKQKKVFCEIGTDSCKEFSHGNIFPVCAVPNGMNLFTFLNQKTENWFYRPDSTSFYGFLLSHQPSPWIGDYGPLLFTFTDQMIPDENNLDFYQSFYRKEDYQMQPECFEIFLQKEQIHCAITPTTYGGMIKADYQNDLKHQIVLYSFSMKVEVLFISKQSIAFKMRVDNRYFKAPFEFYEYFYIELDQPFQAKIFQNSIRLYFTSQHCQLKVINSFLSIQQAQLNFKRELQPYSFSQIRLKAKRRWQQKLNKIVVQGKTPDEELFVSCLYRLYIYPNIFYELYENEEPYHLSMKDGSIQKGKLYVNHGYWDAYRTTYPLLGIIDRALYRDILDGMIQFYLDTGYLPKWLAPYELGIMPGNLAEAVIAEAVSKKVLTDKKKIRLLFTAMLQSSEEETKDSKYGRKKINLYRHYGYLPYADVSESVNETLDYAYGDYCIAQVARVLGEVQTEKIFTDRSQNFLQLWDNDRLFMRAKDKEGCFIEPFDCFAWGNPYTEGSAWQNSFSVPHAIEQLNEWSQGRLLAQIDRLFKMPPVYHLGAYPVQIHEMAEMASASLGQCAISNQPSFSIPYLYAKLKKPKKTNQWMKKILTQYFHNTTDGFPGDEDNGSMAAYYILSSIGIYPFCPGSEEYLVIEPTFDKITLHPSSKHPLVFAKNEYDISMTTIHYSKLKGK